MDQPDRISMYQNLVAKRKDHVFPEGFLNPSKIEGGSFDSDQLGPWSFWRWDHTSKDDALFHLWTLMPRWMGHVPGL